MLFTCAAPGCGVVGQEGGVSFTAAECFTKHLPNAPQVGAHRRARMTAGRERLQPVNVSALP